MTFNKSERIKKRSRTFLPDFKLQPDALKKFQRPLAVAYDGTVFTVLIILAATL
jgi:hypothetical protein